MLFPGFLVDANDLGRLGGIDGADFIGGLDALATDDQIVFAAQFAPNLIQGTAHLADVFLLGEVDKLLILERTLMHARLHAGGASMVAIGIPFGRE